MRAGGTENTRYIQGASKALFQREKKRGNVALPLRTIVDEVQLFSAVTAGSCSCSS
jgi:hypothetical protein